MTATVETRAKYTADELKAMLAKGHAIKNADGDPSYPIADEDDLHKAIRAVGRGGSDHDAIRRHIISRAKALGKSSMIPDDWNADGSIGESKGLDRAAFELRKRRRGSMFGKPERRGLLFDTGMVELRAKPSGHGTTNYEFNGYAVVYERPFEMWDQWGARYEENVETRACAPSVARADLDTPFLIGHDDGGIALARTRSGTMRLADESHGLHVNVPDLDGRSPLVQSLASAIERKDMDEMSVGFVCRRQQWSDDWARRNVQEMDIHRGDVSIVVLGANSATAGATLTVPGLEAAAARRRTEERAQDEITDTSKQADFNVATDDPADNGAPRLKCPYSRKNGCGQMLPGSAKFCPNCGGAVYDGSGTLVVDDSGVVQESMGDADLLSRRLRLLELA
jgi:HK97 family phage prohead protease